MKLALVAFLIISVGCSTSKKVSDFPYPRYEKEFSDLMAAAAEYAKESPQDSETFENLTLPYAPLDISSSEEMDITTLKGYRNFSFGAIAGVLKVDSKKRSEDYFCTVSCWNARFNKTQKDLDSIRELIVQFRKLQNITLISHWRIEDKFRINNLLWSAGKWVQAIPSVPHGLLSSGNWEKPSQSSKDLEELKLNAEPIVQLLFKLDMVAIRKTKDGSIVVVADGFADNSWGIILPTLASSGYLQRTQQIQLMDLQDDLKIYRDSGGVINSL